MTDNATNVAKCAKIYNRENNVHLITYGSSAHLLNLLGKDLEISNIKLSEKLCWW